MSASPLEKSLEELLGLRISLETLVPGRHISVRVPGFERPNGFRVDVRRHLSWIEARFYFDNLASELQSLLQERVEQQSSVFEASLASLQTTGVEYDFSLSESEFSQSFEWREFSSRILLGENVPIWDAQRLAVMSILLPVLQLVRPYTGEESAIDTSQSREEAVPSEFDVEGRIIYRLSRSYERSRTNRALAIELHGRTCFVCRFSFSSVYGDIAENYVEIHHLVPVSMMDSPGVVDPRTDLVPLCANCHRVVHRQWPPIPPFELKDIVAKRSLTRSSRN